MVRAIMETLESNSQSFFVRVWVEEKSEQGEWGVWRGHIVHVPSGEKHYFRDLNEIQTFIAPHLEEMGVRFDTSWRVALWFKRMIKRS